VADYFHTTNGEVYTDFPLSFVPGLRLATLYFTRGKAVTFSGGEGAPIFDRAVYDKLKATTAGRAPTLGYAIELAAKAGAARVTPTPPVEPVPTPGQLPAFPTPTTDPTTGYPYKPPQPGVTEQPWFWPTVVVGSALVLYAVLAPRADFNA